MTKPTLVFIHGAFSSTEVFNYFKVRLPEYNHLTFSYDWNDSTTMVGAQLAAFLHANVSTRSRTTDIILIGHSLGGNVALHALPYLDHSDIIKVKQVITYGSPFGGSRSAFLAGIFSRLAIFGHIKPTSYDVTSLPKIVAGRTNITSFVTSRGPLNNDNDGVVSVASQTALSGPKYVPIDANHMEVLLSNKVIAATTELLNT